MQPNSGSFQRTFKFWFLSLTRRLLDWRTNNVWNQLEEPHARIERRRRELRKMENQTASLWPVCWYVCTLSLSDSHPTIKFFVDLTCLNSSPTMNMYINSYVARLRIGRSGMKKTSRCSASTMAGSPQKRFQTRPVTFDTLRSINRPYERTCIVWEKPHADNVNKSADNQLNSSVSSVMQLSTCMS